MRAPLTSVLNGAKLGVTGFIDAGKVWNFGERDGCEPGTAGVGGGVFLIASVVTLNLDVARGLKTGDTRVHLSSGFHASNRWSAPYPAKLQSAEQPRSWEWLGFAA